MALDADTRQVVAVATGDRSEETARRLWEAVPAAYRAGATCFTDLWGAYAAALPAARHRPSAKGSGLNNHVERFFNTLRQRCARVVRKALSFSKCTENHIGALWYFIRHYNLCRA